MKGQAVEEDFAGKVAIVTGAARGIGRGIALRLARIGCDVAVSDLDLAGAAQFGEVLSAESVQAEIIALGRRAIGVEGDLGQADAADALVQRTVAELGRVDFLINCAGGATISHEQGIASATTEDEAARVWGANYFSMVNCVRAAVPHMRRQGGGGIVNIASTSGFRTPSRGLIAQYAASKAAMISYTRSLAGELGASGIRVNAVAPGTVETARIRALSATRPVGTPEQRAAIPLGRFGQPEDIAKVVQFFLSDLAAFVTGECIGVSGGETLSAS